MSDVYLIRGGPCIPMCLPFCGPHPGDRAARIPYPTRVAGEYGRGDFTLGSYFDMLNNSRFRETVQEASVGVGDVISLLLVPEEHTVSDVFVKVYPNNNVVAPVSWAPPRNAAGATFSVVARRYSAAGVLLGTLAQPAGLADLDFAPDDGGSPPKLIDLAIRQPIEGGAGYFVPTGSWLEFGLQIETMPSDATVKIEDLTTAVGLVVKVHDYQHPLML